MQVMGIYKGKRKRGLTLTVRKKTTYSTLKSFENAKVVIQMFFRISSSSILMKFDTHKH